MIFQKNHLAAALILKISEPKPFYKALGTPRGFMPRSMSNSGPNLGQTWPKLAHFVKKLRFFHKANQFRLKWPKLVLAGPWSGQDQNPSCSSNSSFELINSNSNGFPQLGFGPGRPGPEPRGAPNVPREARRCGPARVRPALGDPWQSQYFATNLPQNKSLTESNFATSLALKTWAFRTRYPWDVEFSPRECEDWDKMRAINFKLINQIFRCDRKFKNFALAKFLLK